MSDGKPKKRVIVMIGSGSSLRHNDDPDVKLSPVGRCVTLIFGWAHCGSTWFPLALTISES